MKRIREIYKHIGGENNYIGEPITITEHCLQAGTRAYLAGETKEVQLACFLHDVGHLIGLQANLSDGNNDNNSITANKPYKEMDGCGILDHEKIGSNYVEQLNLGETVSYLVRNHANAKRYLCSIDPGYYDTLTQASKTTLRYQGGLMTPDEIQEFASNPLHKTALRCRMYDDGGKIPEGKTLLKQDYFFNLLEEIRERNHVPPKFLSCHELQEFKKNGFLVLKNKLPVSAQELNTITNELLKLPTDSPHYPWIMYHEKTKNNRIDVCRIENYTEYHTKWNDIANYIKGVMSDLFQEPAVLFKDKINFKPAGGGGFLPHQDATAYQLDNLPDYHISAMVAIDPALKIETGPLEFVEGQHTQGIFQHIQGVISETITEKMCFQPIFVNPGDIVVFDSYAPHQSKPNVSNFSRRLAYLTYNRASDGDFKQEYYRKRNKRVHNANEKTGSISINNDFTGNVISNTSTSTSTSDSHNTPNTP